MPAMHRIATLALAVVVLGMMSHPTAGPPAEAPEPPAPAPVVVVFPSLPAPVVVVQAAPAAVPAPPVLSTDPFDLGPCPAPNRRATDAWIGEVPEGIEINEVLPSPYDARLLAAWSSDVVVMSTDEGRVWRRVLDGEHGVGTAAFDCHGRLHVVRGDGDLGTYDPGAAERETWVKAASLDDSEIAYAALVPDGGGVALIGVDAGDDELLLLARRDARGVWRSAPLYKDENHGSWDGIYISGIRPPRDGRFRMLATPWSGGECGYSEYREVRFDLALTSVREIEYEEEPVPPGWKEPELDFHGALHRDAAGRWVAVSYQGEGRRIVRMTDRERRELAAEETDARTE
jgi:hypothetical protein